MRSRVLPVQTVGFVSLGAEYFWLHGVMLTPHLPPKSFVPVGPVLCHHNRCNSVAKLALFFLL